MSRVIDLATRGRGGGSSEPLRHPAGVTLPFEGPSDAALIIPEIRSEIRSGAYDAEMIAMLDAALRPGDRVLVIGAGLGVLSTLVAGREGVERVIAVEANTALIPYLERTHALNGVEVETVNAVLAEGKKGRVPFFARRDPRTSSLLPHDRSWQQVMMVPFMDLNLILAEERITLIVSEIPCASAGLLARAALDRVERVLLSTADDPSSAWEDDGVCAQLVARGFVPEARGAAVLFQRAEALGAPAEEAARAGAEMPEAAAEEIEQGEPEEIEEREEEVEEAEAPAAAEAPRGAAPEPPAPRPAGEAEAKPEPTAAPAAEPAEAGGGGGEEPSESAPAAGSGDGARGRRLWGLVAVALLLALPLMLIGWLADERGGARMAALEETGASWGGPQTLTGPFLLVPVAGAEGEAAAPLVILPERIEVETEIETAAAGDEAPGAPVYRSRSEIRVRADLAGSAALLRPGETAAWDAAWLGLGISEPAALGTAEILGGAGAGDFAPGSGVADLPGIHAAIGDPRGQDGGWRILLELDGWRRLGLAPAGGLTVWRAHGDWPHAAWRGPFRPALGEAGPRGFVTEWRVPEVAHARPRLFRGTRPLTTLGEAALAVELAEPFDLYRTVERAAKFGLLVIVLTFGAVLLVERSARREGRLVHYALIGAAQCAFFLLLLPLAERLGFAGAYALAATATTALLTAYAWSGLGFGPRAGWVALALAALYGVMYPILAAREQVLLMGAVLAFLVIGGLMLWTRANGRAARDAGG